MGKDAAKDSRWYLHPLPVLGMLTGSLLITACGPSREDFVGSYDVSAQESLTDCDRAVPRASSLSDVTEVEIGLGSYDDLEVVLKDCEATATLSDSGDGIVLASQKCLASLDDPTAKVTFTGEGSVTDRQLTLTLAGEYKGTDSFGYPVTCGWTLSLSPVE